MCKGRFSGHWSQSSGKWSGQEQLLAAAAAAADAQQQRQANLVLLDYPIQAQQALQQRLLDADDMQNMQVRLHD